MRNDSLSFPKIQTTYPLIGIGLTLVKVTPAPPVKLLGIVAITAGLGLALFDEIQRRKVVNMKRQ